MSVLSCDQFGDVEREVFVHCELRGHCAWTSEIVSLKL